MCEYSESCKSTAWPQNVCSGNGVSFERSSGLDAHILAVPHQIAVAEIDPTFGRKVRVAFHQAFRTTMASIVIFVIFHRQCDSPFQAQAQDDGGVARVAAERSTHASAQLPSALARGKYRRQIKSHRIGSGSPTVHDG